MSINLVDLGDYTVEIETTENEIGLEFYVYSDNEINFQEITRITQTTPTIIYNKGDAIRIDLCREEYAWRYHTNYILDLSIEPILSEIMSTIQNPNELGEYCKENGHRIKMNIVIRNVVDILAGIYYPKRFLHFCSILDADIEVTILL